MPRRSPATQSPPSIRVAPRLPAALPTPWYYPRCVTPPAGLSPEFAPDELVSLYGSKLADTEAAAPMPQSLGGLSVNIADATGAVYPAGLSYVSPSQVNFLIPSGMPRGAALVTIVRAGTVVAAVPVTIASVAPGIFAASQIVRTESGAAYLVLYGTGIRNRTGNTAVTCMMNGTPLPVTYAGAQPDYAGLDQVNVPLPSDLRPTGSAERVTDGRREELERHHRSYAIARPRVSLQSGDTMFSSRFHWDPSPNRLTRALAAKRAAGARILDLTESNPTHAGLHYPDEIVQRV